MSDDLGQEIRDLFAKAVLKHDAARHLNADERLAYQKIHDDHAGLVRFEERRFEIEFQTRFETARQRIIDEGGSKNLNLVHRSFGSDKFDAGAIDRQANREVRHEHANALARLEKDRDERLDTLIAVAEQRRQASGRLKQEFGQATDRRSGQERRRGPAR